MTLKTIKAALALTWLAVGLTHANAADVDLRNVQTTASFVDSIGVNTHLTWLDSVYTDPSFVQQKLEYLGVRHIRDGAPPHWWTSPYEKLAAAGYRFNFFIPVNDGAAQVEGSIERAARLQQQFPGSVAMIEGPNEVNNWPAPYQGESDLPSAGRLQRDLYVMVKGNTWLKDLPVAPLTLAGAGVDDFAPLGDLRGAADLSNAHVYFPAGSQPSSVWDWALSSNATPTQGHPHVITETGYYDLPDGDRGVSPAVQGKQTLNILFRSALTHVQRTYLYQLIDNFTDRQNEAENRYGLFHANGSPKLAATAIHNLTAILAPEGAVSASVEGTFTYDLKGLPTDASSVVMKGSDGTVWLAVWAEPQIWDNGQRKEIAAPVRSVTLQLRDHAGIRVYDPYTSKTPIDQKSEVDNLRFDLTDRPILIAVSASLPVRSGSTWYRIPG